MKSNTKLLFIVKTLVIVLLLGWAANEIRVTKALMSDIPEDVPAETQAESTAPAETEPIIPIEAVAVSLTEEPAIPAEPAIPSYEEFMSGIYDKKVYAMYEKLFSMYDYEQFMTRSQIPQYFQSVYYDTRYHRFASGTIKSSGCGISCLAMITSYLYDTTITPDMLTMNYTDNNPAWILELWVTEKYLNITMDMNYGDNAVTAFDSAMAEGKPVILLHRSNEDVRSLFTAGGHFIVVTGMTEDGRYIVNDPNMYNLCCLEEMNCVHAQNGELCPLVDEYMNGFTRDQLVGPKSGLVGTYVFDAKDDFKGDPSRLPHR